MIDQNQMEVYGEVLYKDKEKGKKRQKQQQKTSYEAKQCVSLCMRVFMPCFVSLDKCVVPKYWFFLTYAVLTALYTFI